MIHNPGHLHLKRMLSERTIAFTPSNCIFFYLSSKLVLIRLRCEQYLYVTEL